VWDFEKQEVIPIMAESIEQPDQVTYVWKLRPGVRFQNVDPVNGRALTAEDAQYSFERLKAIPTMNEKSLVSLYTDNMTATDAATFTLKTKQPYSFALIKSGTATYGIVPKEAVDKWGDLARHAAGSGPFIFVEHTRGEGVKFRRNPDYFRTGRPYVDEEEWLVATDAAMQWEMLRTGRLDSPLFLSADKFKREELSKSGNIVLTKGYDTAQLFWMRVDRPPLNDERVREALECAIDRDDLLNKTYFSEGVWNGPVPGSLSYWALPQDELRQTLKYDPEKSKQLLSAAGYGGGLEFKPPIRSDDDASKIMTVLADDFQQVGIRVTIQMMDVVRWLTALYAGDYEITTSRTMPILEPEIFLRYYHSKGTTGADNSTKINDPEMDALVEGLSSIFGTEQQKEYVLKAQREILKKHGPMICLCTGEAWRARNKRIKYAMSPDAGPLFWMGTEYWIDEA
jgi:peptide/nickel transport system substrate-binding protein